MKTTDLTTSNQLGASCYERVRTALSYLNPTDRDLWVKYGTCVKAEFGDEGFDLWAAWGSQAKSHKTSSTRSVWKSINAAGKLTIASLFYDAKSAGWKDDSKYTTPTKEQIDARNAAVAARLAQAEAEEAAAREAALVRAQTIWGASVPATSHPYLAKKGVQAHGLRIGVWDKVDDVTGEVTVISKNALLVPICDQKKVIRSLQAIFPDGTKSYLMNGAKRGHMYCIGTKPLQHDGKNVFVLVEGYATGASLHECTGHLVVVCFDTGGLGSVAAQIRARQPEAIIIFAADNDAQTEGNPGVRAARKAALEVGGLVAMPPPGDFNDLHLERGAFAVASIVQGVLGTPIISIGLPKGKHASGVTA